MWTTRRETGGGFGCERRRCKWRSASIRASFLPLSLLGGWARVEQKVKQKSKQKVDVQMSSQRRFPIADFRLCMFIAGKCKSGRAAGQSAAALPP
ncbi:hypothetical protein RRF57_012685 [Xylaria bambusicola]|uniref:Uncharacterized protein n=1 Tax=Xylaria bambusicola TaxID=326684 RepID=A0AAN7UWZ8_9PEZI